MPASSAAEPSQASERSGPPRFLVLAAFAVSGGAALTYEVVWTRALSVILGSTTHALSSMLATFMLGLAIGGFVGGRVASRTRRPIAWLGAVELGIGLLGIASHVLIELLPAVFLAAYRALHLSAPGYFAAQVGICAIVMLAPTVLMGMTFPLVTRGLVRDLDDVGRSVGLAYAVNTIGAVAGALLSGFVLVPDMGLRGTALVAAGANAVVGSILLARTVGRRAVAVLPVIVVYVVAGAAMWRTERAGRFVNFYSVHNFTKGEYEVVAAGFRYGLTKLFEREGRDGVVAAYRDLKGHLILQIGGKIEGTSEEDQANTELLSYLPVASHQDPKRMLVIGLGAGVTLDVARKIVPSVDLVEINSDVLEAVRLHGPPGVLDGARVFRDDARNLLLRTDERWDVISSEPSYPTDFAVSNLFSREFYSLARDHLNPGGVFCQWLPYYLLTNDDVTMMVKTFGNVFENVTLWKVEGSMDLLLVGSPSPFQHHERWIKERVAELSGGHPLSFVLSRDVEQVREIERRPDVPINTDDRPRLEFAVARNLRVGDIRLLE